MTSSSRQKLSMLKLAKSIGIDIKGINVGDYSIKELTSILEQKSFQMSL